MQNLLSKTKNLFRSLVAKAKQHPKISIGISLAASWAWGTSLVVGIEIIQTKGILPFIIWAIANTLSLPLFGLIAFRIKKLDAIVNSKPVMVFTTIVQIFCMWINMNAIYQILSINTGFVSETTGKIVAIVIAVVFLFILSKNGIWRGIIADSPIWNMCYVCLIAAAIIGFCAGTPTFAIQALNGGDTTYITWALNTCVILFSGPIMDIQNWQIAKEAKEKYAMNAYNFGGILFGLYMVLVLILGCLQFNVAMNICLVIIVVCVATSTIDNAIVGVQKIAGPKVGFIIAAVSIVSWRLVQNMGVMGLWTFMGNWRKWVAIACIVIALVWGYVEKRKKAKTAVLSNEKTGN